ncbi:hypothetical protein MEO41_28400, partial [Dolichospermum sp. ST_sed4]|nr:hypothetical protein [Dolichospermum sp. ST_sed4]
YQTQQLSDQFVFAAATVVLLAAVTPVALPAIISLTINSSIEKLARLPIKLNPIENQLDIAPNQYQSINWQETAFAYAGRNRGVEGAFKIMEQAKQKGGMEVGEALLPHNAYKMVACGTGSCLDASLVAQQY